MCLNHPELPPPPPPALVYGKIVFHEICPWCQNGWRMLSESIFHFYKQDPDGLCQVKRFTVMLKHKLCHGVNGILETLMKSIL